MKYYVIYKPFGMLSQFTPEGGNRALGELHDFPPNVYPIGRLDTDSEGLLILSNDRRLNHILLDPQYGHKRTYLVQVDGAITSEAVEELKRGVTIRIKKKDYKVKALHAEILDDPGLPDRDPPIRYRANIPTSWISVTIAEGKNRQVRRMCAQVGFPALRLVRQSIEDLSIDILEGNAVLDIRREEIFPLLKL